MIYIGKARQTRNQECCVVSAIIIQINQNLNKLYTSTVVSLRLPSSFAFTLGAASSFPLTRRLFFSIACYQLVVNTILARVHK